MRSPNGGQAISGRSASAFMHDRIKETEAFFFGVFIFHGPCQGLGGDFNGPAGYLLGQSGAARQEAHRQLRKFMRQIESLPEFRGQSCKQFVEHLRQLFQAHAFSGCERIQESGAVASRMMRMVLVTGQKACGKGGGVLFAYGPKTAARQPFQEVVPGRIAGDALCQQGKPRLSKARRPAEKDKRGRHGIVCGNPAQQFIDQHRIVGSCSPHNSCKKGKASDFARRRLFGRFQSAPGQLFASRLQTGKDARRRIHGPSDAR